MNSLAAPAAAEVRNLAQAPVRIVWCQDRGAGGDANAEGTNLCLMGFDSEDDRGERAILPQLSNYARPLLTPRGNRVIFSNRQENKIYIVNWDGSALRRLGNGFAVSVWLDPATGVEWVYGGSWLTNTDAISPIQRAPIDQPDRIETVWTRTPVNPDNFQLSADGRRAGGNLPWPVCGIVELPDRDWKKYGEGCWPALAPENAGLFWIFDGTHRNLTVFRTGADEHWVININQAPGCQGFEVYHPRWSNRARFLVMTGPYKIGSGANRIRGGGREVEIFLGRFDERFRAIERWARVTCNDRGDFFPDAWIGPTPFGLAVPATNRPPEPPPASVWPGNTEGLIYLWENRARKNELRRPDSAAVRVCRADPRGAARYGRYFEMDLAHGPFSTDSDSGAQLLAACRNSNRFSLEAVLTPAPAATNVPAPIITFAGFQSANFTLGQEGAWLTLRLNTSDAAGLGPAIPLCRLDAGAPQQVMINYLPGQLTCFLNGQPALLTNAPTGNLEGWLPGDLVFGDRARFWPGRLDHVAIYSRARAESDARRNYAALAAELKRRTPARRLVLEARLADATKTPAPATIAPYRRALAIDRYDNVKVLEGQCPDKEILAAHWVILDGEVLPGADRPVNSRRRLALEPFDEHPELEGERVVMDNENYLLPLFYEVE